MKAMITSPCVHGDKEYAVGDRVTDAKKAKALVEAGVAVEDAKDK